MNGSVILYPSVIEFCHFIRGKKHVDFKWETEKKFLRFLDLLVMRKQKENSVASRGSNSSKKFICITTPFEVSELLV